MACLLDTNAVIHALQGDVGVLEELVENEGAVMLSALTLAELLRGVHKEPKFSHERARRLELLKDSIPILPFDDAAAETYGRLIAVLDWVRARDYDRMIVAHAIRANAVLVTNARSDFIDVPGLTIESW